MVDKERRRKLALHLRHLSVGRITNDDFEERVWDDVSNGWLPEQYYRAKEISNDDPIIRPMLEFCWCLYSGTEQHKLKGRYQLTNENLKNIARFILFLRSDIEYSWPYFDQAHPLIRFSLKDLLLSVLTLGQHYRNKMVERQKQFDEFKAVGDYDYWPFIEKAQFEEQKRYQPFLAGRRSELI